jgi:AcrR family transcriptional regulator
MVINDHLFYMSEPSNKSEVPAADLRPALPGRRQRKAAETRLRIFRSALQLFGERGFGNVTVEEITEAADVGKGTFFNYFDSKEHVLGVMADVQLARVEEAVLEAAAGKHSIRATLHHLFLRLSEEPGRSPFLARTFIGSFLANGVVRTLLRDRMAAARAMLERLIQRGQASGEIDGSLTPEDVAFQMQQAVLGAVLLWSLHEKPEVKVWIDKSFQHFWRAVASPRKGKKQ